MIPERAILTSEHILDLHFQVKTNITIQSEEGIDDVSPKRVLMKLWVARPKLLPLRQKSSRKFSCNKKTRSTNGNQSCS